MSYVVLAISALAIVISVCSIRNSRAVLLRVNERLREIEVEDGLPIGWLDDHPHPAELGLPRTDWSRT